MSICSAVGVYDISFPEVSDGRLSILIGAANPAHRVYQIQSCSCINRAPGLGSALQSESHAIVKLQ